MDGSGGATCASLAAEKDPIECEWDKDKNPVPPGNW